MITPLRVLGAVCLAVVVARPLHAASLGEPGVINCFTRNNGPCRFPEARDVLLRPGADDVVLVTNFGLVLRASDGTGWDFVCEEQIGGLLSQRVAMDANGRLFVPGGAGFFRSADSCEWSRAVPISEVRSFSAVLIDPGDPSRVWALATEPRGLWLSHDAGATFALRMALPENLSFTKIFIAPSSHRTIFLTGYGRGIAAAVMRSDDGGETWNTIAPAFGFTAPNRLVDVVGVSPEDPSILFFASSGEKGGADELWQSLDGGRSARRVFTLRGAEILAGFTFGPDPGSVFLAGRDLFEAPKVVPGHLYKSKDGAMSWEEPIPSDKSGPRYSCLAFRGRDLYACGADPALGDKFLLGKSTNEGRSWTPVVRMDEIRGVRGCASGVCVATAAWLCDVYGRCDGVAGSPSATDASSPDGPADTADPKSGGGRGGGCACSLGRSDLGHGTGLSVLMCLAAIIAVRRRHSHPRSLR